MISEKRAKVLRRRASLRKVKKAERLDAYTALLNFAKANPTPKLKHTVRLRMRNALQIAEWGDNTGLMNPKLGAKFSMEQIEAIGKSIREQKPELLAAREQRRNA